jgi:hypothetical protein
VKPTPHTKGQLPADERKRMLLLQGQVFRSGLALAQHDVRAALEPKSLLRNVMGGVVDTGTDAARHLLSLQSLMDGRLAMFLPLAGKGISLLARRGLLRSVSVVLLTAGVGSAGWYFWKRRRAQTTSARHHASSADSNLASDYAGAASAAEPS